VKKEEPFLEAKLSRMTVSKLKDKRLPTVGKKQDLIDRHLGS
jgi:hypothetical protein